MLGFVGQPWAHQQPQLDLTQSSKDPCWLFKRGLKRSFKGDIDIDVEVDVDINRYFGC